MNVGNILKVADAIEQASVPGLGFNMRTFGRGSGPLPDKSGHDCGTVACVAGWTYAVATAEIPEDRRSLVPPVASKFLGLTGDEAQSLFLMSGGGFGTYDTDFANAILPEHAVRCLRILAITGKVDWAAAMKGDEPVMPPLPVKTKRVRA